MQLLRFQGQNIYVLEKSVQFCGKTFTRSKKRVKWVIKHNDDIHQINCAISFFSGKKIVTHNGHTIIKIVDDRKSLDFVLIIGYEKMVFVVDEYMEDAKLQRRYQQACLKIFIHSRQGRFIRNFMVDQQDFFILTSKTLYNERLIIEIKPIFIPKQSIQIFIFYNNSNPMITTKLKKGGTAKSLFIQFSAKPLPFVFSQFLSICKEQGVYIKLEDIPQNQARIYLAHGQKTVQMKGIKLENLPSNFQSVLTIIYLNCDEDEKLLAGTKPLNRTLLIREGLQTKFYIDYQFQNTQSQNQSIVYLCQLSSMIFNSRLEGDIDFYDQKSEQIKSISEQTIKQMLWKNIFYQIPGLGKEKCILITQKYPSYESLLQDFQGSKQLKNLQVSHGTKEIKLGSILANRIYRCLLEQNGQLNIHEE